VEILRSDVKWHGVLKKKGVKEVQVNQWLGIHLKRPKTTATARNGENLYKIIAVMSGESHDIFSDKWGKPTWTIPITSGESPVLN